MVSVVIPGRLLDYDAWEAVIVVLTERWGNCLTTATVGGVGETRIDLETAAAALSWGPVVSRGGLDVRGHAWVDLDDYLGGVLLTQHAVLSSTLRPSEDVEKGILIVVPCCCLLLKKWFLILRPTHSTYFSLVLV